MRSPAARDIYVAAQLVAYHRPPGARSSGGRGLARPVVPGGDSLLAVLVSIRSNVVTAATSIAIVTATAKSMTAVRWLFRWLGMRKPPQHRKTLCGLDGSTHLRLRAPKFGTGSAWYSRLTRWKMVGSGLNSRDGGNCSMQLRRRVRRTEEKLLVPHTDNAICAVCGAALESWSEHPRSHV